MYCAFVGSLQLTPRTRYHHVPGVSGSTADVASVRKPAVPPESSGLNG
jgi:hypothetical protein